MGQVITLEGYTPVARYDSIPWTQARIEEGATIDGPWTVIDTKALSPVDADPSHPATRNFTTENGSAATNYWYRVVFLDATGDDTLPTSPFQNGAQAPYITTAELARKLQLNAATYQAQLQRVADAASYEIDAELGRTTPLSAMQIQLVGEVALDRAIEHWQQGSTPFGFLGLGGGEPGVGAFAASDTWNRHAHKLAPLKQSWGLA